MLGPRCLENPPSLIPDSGAGTLQKLGGLDTYVTGSPDSKLAILLIADGLGYEAPNLRKLADKVAAAGYFVVAPDFYYGDPVDQSNPQFDIETWARVHNKDKGYEDAKQVIAALKSKGMSTIGVAGFCWGGTVAVKLASSPDIKAAVILHPGPIAIDEINEVKVPISFLGAEIDKFAPPEQLIQFGEILSAKPEFDSFVKIFPGVSHGWTMCSSLADESAVRMAEEAHSDMLNWFVNNDLPGSQLLRYISNEVEVPISFLGAEIDRVAPPEQLGQLSAKSEFDSFVKIFPGVSHGWTMRYSDEDESAVQIAEEAHSDTLNWFCKHVK